MTELRASDRAARRRALDVTRSFIVQAPAGSGKTELLTQRFLALLATVERPESVLAITFTRKAAAEMRNRILAALRAASDPAAGLPEELLPETRALALAVLELNARRGWDLLGNPSRLRLQTIDSLNQGLARRLPVLSGAGGGLRVEEDARALYRLAAEALLDQLPGESARDAAAVSQLLRHLDNNVPTFVTLVAEMLARREAWLPELPGELGPEAPTVRAALEAARRALVRGHLAALAAAAPMDWLVEACTVAREAAANLPAEVADSALATWRDGDALPGEDPADAPLWQGLAALLLTGGGTPRKRFDRNIGIPPAAAPLKQRAVAVAAGLERRDDLVQLLEAASRLPPPAYEEAEWQVLQALFRVLRLAAAELAVVFANRQQADYPQFAAAARRALGPEEEPTDTALALDARLHHVLVDEFQDTSEAQVRLLERLTAGWTPGDGRTVFLVGDPMQSIYRFRHAEVGLFLAVRDRGLGQGEPRLLLEPLTLRVNFRSTQPVVDWVNRCFAQVLPPRDDDLRGAVSYAASVPKEGAGEDGGVQVHAFLRRSRRLEAERVAEIAAARLAEDPRARIAVLVQGRSHLLHIVAELGRRGIAFQATDIDPLGERPAVLDALSIARALVHHADRPAWLAVLRAPWCGLTLAELQALVGDDREATVLELTLDPARRARLARPARERLERTLAVLETAVEELRRFGLRDTLERSWLALGGPATLAHERELEEVEAFLDELAEVENRARGTVNLGLLAEALAELYAPSPPRPGTRVELLTIHKAKGLQFDTVIVPGLDRSGRGEQRRLLQWMRMPQHPHGGLVVAPLASVGYEANVLYAWLEGLERERLLQERRRLLYVAATRAERWLHLLGSCSVAPDRKSGAAALRAPARTTALGLLWPVLEPEFARRLAEVGDVPGEEAEPLPRDPPLARLPDGWQVPAAPPGPRIEAEVYARVAELMPVEFDWATETARHVGTVVHRELQRIAHGSPGPEPASPRSLARFNAELAELGVPEERRAEAAGRVREAILRALADERGRWLLDSRQRGAVSELALTGRIGGEIVSVVIDRTLIDEHGVRWIVDYKTSTHAGAGLKAFLDSEQERYRGQLERYATLVRHLGPEPIRLGLYFPLLSAWREWSPG